MTVEVDPTCDPARLLASLRAALDDGPALLPLDPGRGGGAVREAARLDEPVPDGTALLLPTSGSTGTPKVVELGRAALRHSARATHERLGGPGRWLLALPLTHVAGWQVLVRSLEAGLDPGVLDPGTGFDPHRFARAAHDLPGPRRYTSLVPAQLGRLLDDESGRAGAAALDAVLLGGAAAPAALLERARGAGIRVVTTYGTTETCGGCVYDGLPLAGVDVRLEDDGRVLLAGAVLASGYRGRGSRGFVTRGGRPWFRTADAGRLTGDGRLEVLGRLDDVLVSGGENVAPAAVEAVLAGLPGISQCVVVGVPDPRWGQAVTAVVVPAPGPVPTLPGVRAALRDLLPAHALPRHLVLVDALPLRGPGKPDRAAAADLADAAVAAGG